MSTNPNAVGGGGGQQPWQFTPETYGAKGDGITDDTAAINLAVSAAVTYALANRFYAEIIFKAVTYLLSAATTQSATFNGNAQIPLPLVSTTSSQKLTLVFRGTRDQTALPHWTQTVTQAGGAVLKTTFTGSNNATWGESSVIGGPTPAKGYGNAATLFSNIMPVIDGITILNQNNPSMCGFDFRGCSEANVINAMVMANSVPGSFAAPTNSWQFGLAMPQNGNNDNCNIGWYSCEGQNYGLVSSEHTTAQSIRCIYCVAGIEHAGGGGTGGVASSTGHGAWIGYASLEACQVALGSIGSAYPAKIDIALLDWEAGSGSFAEFHAINDSGSVLIGDINWVANGAGSSISAVNINVASNLRVIDTVRQSGPATAPGVPATTVALSNPFWRNATVVITSGGAAVTAIAVNGTATGLTLGTSGSVTVRVPTGGTITLTYASTAPTWTWVLD